MGAECFTFVSDLIEGIGELCFVDVPAGVGADDTGFFHVEFVEASGQRGALVALVRFGLGGYCDVSLGGLAETVGVAE